MSGRLMEQFPELLSPLHLAKATWGERFRAAPHLVHINRVLYDVSWSEGGARLMVNLPYQHGKSTLVTEFYPAWHLLLFPDTRITLVMHGSEFAEEFGGKVKAVLERWGPPLGLKLQEDTKAKGNWKITGHTGGMFCTGPGGGAVGRPADLFLIDDLIRTPEQALSPTILQNHWNFFETTVQGRLRNHTSLVLVGTRWSKNDLFGRILRQTDKTHEAWTVLKFKALAEKDDPLGRPPGAPLWPENVSLAHLERIRATNRWWRPCWQQEPLDEEGQYFRPSSWPVYRIQEETYITSPDSHPQVTGYWDGVRFAAVDWAFSEKKTADFTAIGVFVSLPGKRTLLLDMVNERVPLEECVPLLARVCKKHRPSFVVAESTAVQASILRECESYPEIPPIRPVSPGGKTKLQRALTAILEGEQGHIYLPREAPWLADYTEQLAAFTGQGEGHDDMVDVTAYAMAQAVWLAGTGTSRGEACILTPGKETWY